MDISTLNLMIVIFQYYNLQGNQYKLVKPMITSTQDANLLL